MGVQADILSRALEPAHDIAQDGVAPCLALINVDKERPAQSLVGQGLHQPRQAARHAPGADGINLLGERKRLRFHVHRNDDTSDRLTRVDSRRRNQQQSRNNPEAK